MAATSAESKGSRTVVAGLMFGVAFGFLLQKGGVGKYHVLIGQLLLRDWTVVKIMASAIIVGMLGIYTMKAAGLVEMHIKKTRVGANTIGGLLFGTGFGLSAYCPGTNIAALGQGNWDAFYVAAGLVAGSYLYAEFSGFLDRTVQRWGNHGEVTLFEWLHIPKKVFIPLFAILLGMALFFIEKNAVR